MQLSRAFAYNAFYQFQMIAELCQSAQNAVDDTLRDYVASKWIAVRIESENVIKAEMEQIILARTSTTVNTFRRSFNLVRIPPNYQATIVSDIEGAQLLVRYYNVTDLRFPDYQLVTCVCNIQPNWKIPLVVEPVSNVYQNNTDEFLIPNLLSGCSFINTLMASTLECFFNQSCLDTLQSTMYWPIKQMALRSSSTFLPNTTIQTIVDQMFVESWNTTFNYSAFYYTCRPVFCSYTLTTHKDVGVLIATIISIFGGLYNSQSCNSTNGSIRAR